MPTFPYNPALVLDDGGAAATVTGYGKVGGVAAVYDTGGGPVAWVGYLAAQVSGLDLANGNETYILTVEGSNSPTFASGVVVCGAGAVTAVGPVDLVVNNTVGGTTYRYLRLKKTLGGTTPSLTLMAFLAKQTLVEQYSFAELVEQFQDLLDEMQASAGTGESRTVYEMSKEGIVTTGLVAGQKTAVTTLVTKARSDFVNNVGRMIIAVGALLLNETIEYHNANVDAPMLRHQAQAGFTGTMVKVGRYINDDNCAAVIPSFQRLWAWGGSRTTGIRAGVTCFHLERDASPAAVYEFNAEYAERALLISDDVEKKKVRLRAANNDLVVEIQSTATGSPDTLEVDVTATNYSQLSKIVYGAYGADCSVTFSGNAEGHIAKSDDRNVVTDETGKATTYNWKVRTYNGAGLGAFYDFYQEANDFADTIIFGGEARHIHFYGRALNMRSVRRPKGTFRLRESYNGRMWNPATGKADGAERACEAVFIGRVVDGGDFHLDLSAINNSRYVLYGSDTYYSEGTDFGRSHLSGGAFKPYNGEYPRTLVAAEFYKAINCSFPFSQVHGQMIIRKGIQGCTIRVPSTWAKIGYGLTVDAGAVFTLIIEGDIEYAQALALPWLSQISGDQVVRFESVSDKKGATLTYSAGQWTLSGPITASRLEIGAKSADVVRDLFQPGLVVGCSEDIAGAGADAGKAYVGITDPVLGNRFREVGSGAIVTPAIVPATAAYLTHVGSSEGAFTPYYLKIVDRLLTQMSKVDAITNGMGGWLLGQETSALALKALFPRAGGAGGGSPVWYDATTSGSPIFTARQGFAMNPDTLDKILLGIDPTIDAGILSLNDILVLIGARRDNPAYGGSDNVYDVNSPNGKLKLRDRDNAEQLSVGTTTTTGFGTGTKRMPDVIMGGRISVDQQFAVSEGRIVATGNVRTDNSSGGLPDAIYLGGSRELSCCYIGKASHFFQMVGGVVKPIGERPQVLYRAFTEAMAALERAP